MAYSISEIAAALDARAVGATDLRVQKAAEPQTASRDDLAIAMDPKYADGLSQGQARAALLWADADWQKMGLEAAILVDRPRYALSGLTSKMDPGPDIPDGIHETAIIDPTAGIASDVSIGPFVSIGADVKLASGVRIASHVSIGRAASIGEDALVHAGVRIGPGVQIGKRFIAQPGCVIGADGFSFVTPDKSAVEEVRETVGDRGETQGQSWTRIHSLGSVTIGDDVEVGANSAIDRGTIKDTRVGRGTKIDNLVQIGHNVEIGEDCLLCGLVGVAGSSRIGNRVVLAGQCGVNDNIFVGDDVIAGGASKIFTNVPAGRVILGYPAIKMEAHVETYKALRRLPRLIKQVAELQKAVSKAPKND